jgi:hypothetical protein
MLAVAAADGRILGVLPELVVAVEPEEGEQEEIQELPELQEQRERAAVAAADLLRVVPPELLEVKGVLVSLLSSTINP